MFLGQVLEYIDLFLKTDFCMLIQRKQVNHFNCAFFTIFSHDCFLNLGVIALTNWFFLQIILVDKVLYALIPEEVANYSYSRFCGLLFIYH